MNLTFSAPYSRLAQDSPRRGFALLVTIVLVAFLVLILVGLATFTRVETTVAANAQKQAQARQNALMALNIAIGQLQKTTGPDQRITARADIVTPSTVSSLTPTATALADIDTYWADRRNRNWTGVWSNTTPLNAATYNVANPAAANATPSAPTWLISGSEISTAYNPTTPVTNLSLTSTATSTLTDDNGVAHRLLVGNNTVGNSQLANYVTAPVMPITASNVPGLAASATIGNYAWWVGDEGIKARANLTDTYAPPVSPATALTADERLWRLQSAQRPAIEAATGLSAYPANDANLPRVLQNEQLPFIPGLTKTALQPRFHDLTTYSNGVLADVRDGGLKRDLTNALGQDTIPNFRARLNDSTNYKLIPNTTATASNRMHIGTTTAINNIPRSPYGTLPVNSTGTDSGPAYFSSGTSTIFSRSATWEQLWSYYNFYRLTTGTAAGVYNSAAQIVPRVFTAQQQGINPLLVQVKLFYGLNVSGGNISVLIKPVAVLANPYAVEMAPALYTFTVSGPDFQLVFTPAHATVPASEKSDRGFLDKVNLVIDCPAIPPGKALVFTLDPDRNLTAKASEPIKDIYLKVGFATTDYITYNTEVAVTAAEKVNLSPAFINADFQLYLGAGNSTANFLQRAQSGSSTVAGSGKTVPDIDGTGGQQFGGGIYYAWYDGLDASTLQGIFSQLNLRALYNNPQGRVGDIKHPREWANTTYWPGTATAIANTNKEYIKAHLLFSPSNFDEVRWGFVARSRDAASKLTLTPPGLDADAGFVNILYDLPRPAQPIVSLGQLQHFNTTGFFTAVSPPSPVLNSWQNNYPLANSYAHSQVPRDKIFNSTGGVGYHYDGSYIANHLLWDRFYFSSFPPSGAFDFATNRLINNRYYPFRPAAEVALNDPTKFRDMDPASAATLLAAQNLIVKGSFNINSTSIDAWRALFSSLKGVQIGSETDPTTLTAPFSRTLTPTNTSIDAEKGITANAWAGFRNLSSDEINTFAQEMVMQVRKRGPFLSMADFINRKLIPSASDPYKLGVSGALQAALDANINTKVSSGFNQASTTSAARLADSDYAIKPRIAGFPGFVMQGDILSPIAPYLAARSDTFIIRTYGDVQSPATDAIEASAWCEAVVQRLPDYLDNTLSPSSTPVAGSINAIFGRKYKIISFRWLTSQDI